VLQLRQALRMRVGHTRPAFWAVYYDPARPFSVAELRALVTELDDRRAPEVVGFGDWGPWINGGA
jgi:hypothetical protein